MENIIIGTAGHVDHGKTCLIKALSGIDTDRLKEEKKRGITIENGFANLPNDKGLHLGIIDVPGHEKFVKNMLAGIGGIDLVLLVISLEEGIKPQTIEHFEILKSLGIKKGIVVYTKLDSEVKVDFENLKAQVKDILKGSTLENSKEICVSSFTGQNIEVLKDLIYEEVKGISNRRKQKELTRLPIDRVFTMEGFGTVVTGTLMEGEISVGDELLLYPKEKVVKVRSLESHGVEEESAYAGQRTAINLSGIKKEEIDRGDVLAKKDSIILTDTIICSLIMFKSASRMLKNGERVHFNYGSAQTECNVKLIADGFIQLKFDHLIPVKRNDKYIIRFMTPAETCGGGIVLYTDAKKLKTSDDSTMAFLHDIASNDDKKVLYAIVNDISETFPCVSYIAKKMNLTIAETKSLIDELKSNNTLVEINDIVISKEKFDNFKNNITEILKRFHDENKIAKGMQKAELKSTLAKRYRAIDDLLYEKIVSYLIAENVLKVENELISEAAFNVVIDDKKSKKLKSIEEKYEKAGYEPPDTDSVVSELGNNNGPEKLLIRQMIVDLEKNGRLVKLSKEYYIHKTAFDKAVGIMMKYFETHDKMMMRDLRDLLQTSRKYAILIIDYCDKKRITKLVDDYRVLYKS